MLKKCLSWAVGVIVAILVVGYVATRVSPWPSALFFRWLMDQGGVKAAQALEKHVPPGVAAQLDQQYDVDNGDARLDVFYPAAIENAALRNPTIVWVHGGGFLSGGKEQIANYLKILAARGFTTVGINYSLAPAARYPTPVIQANMALAYLVANAGRFHIDPSRFFLAGDSAGAQIAAQLTNVINVPSYAREMGIVPAIQRSQIRGVILYCGIFDPELLNSRGRFAGFLRTATWSYFGSKDFESDPRMAQFSVVGHVTAQFPPMFISAGNADPLGAHSRQLAATASSRGVAVDGLFFPDDYTPPLSHEYQFDLDTAAGQTALDRSLKFLHDQDHSK